MNGELPKQFGRYRLLNRLASGGMAEVFRAEALSATGLPTQLVIKRIKPALARDPGFTAMFLEEARLLAGLSHANIVQVLDVGEAGSEPYLALELVNGKTLAEIIDELPKQSRRMPPSFASYIALEVCKGLYHAHTRVDAAQKPLKIVHRDISPENVMVSFDGEVKILDFGIARAYGEERPGRQNTAIGVMKGKYQYFAPEQARQLPLDARTDIHALGAVLFEMLTGAVAFEGELVQVMAQAAFGARRKPSELMPSTPPALDDIVVKAMAIDPAARFQTALAMQEALSAFVATAEPRVNQRELGNAVRHVFRHQPAEPGQPAADADFVARFRSWSGVPLSDDPVTVMHRRPSMSDLVEPVARTTPAASIVDLMHQQQTQKMETAKRPEPAEVRVNAVAPKPLDVDSPITADDTLPENVTVPLKRGPKLREPSRAPAPFIAVTRPDLASAVGPRRRPSRNRGTWWMAAASVLAAGATFALVRSNRFRSTVGPYVAPGEVRIRCGGEPVSQMALKLEQQAIAPGAVDGAHQLMLAIDLEPGAGALYGHLVEGLTRDATRAMEARPLLTRWRTQCDAK